MNYGTFQRYMSEALPPCLWIYEGYPALRTNCDFAFIRGMIFTAPADPVFYRAENPLAEQTIFFGELRNRVECSGITDFAIGKTYNLLRRHKRNDGGKDMSFNFAGHLPSPLFCNLINEFPRRNTPNPAIRFCKYISHAYKSFCTEIRLCAEENCLIGF